MKRGNTNPYNNNNTDNKNRQQKMLKKTRILRVFCTFFGGAQKVPKNAKKRQKMAKNAPKRPTPNGDCHFLGGNPLPSIGKIPYKKVTVTFRGEIPYPS
jgi:hypothetical protein